MVAGVGPLAMRYREPGQARKGAAAAVDACAGVWLVSAAALNRYRVRQHLKRQFDP